MHSDLISADEVRTKLDHDDWAIVDTRFYLPEPERGKAEHLDAHIPGAVYAHLDHDLSGPRTGSNGRHPMPSLEHMVDRFSQWGIDENVQWVRCDASSIQCARQKKVEIEVVRQVVKSVESGGRLEIYAAQISLFDQEADFRRGPDCVDAANLSLAGGDRPRTIFASAHGADNGQGGNQCAQLPDS